MTDYRHLNSRIAKNSLAYPIIKDKFVTLGNSKCDVLLVLDFKDAFHSLRLSEKSKKYCGILPYFGSAHIYNKECQWDETFPHQFGNHIETQFLTV